MHVQACAIYMVLNQSRSWTAPLDFGSIQTDVWYKGRGVLFVYMKMLYHSALVFAMVDICPRSPLEIVFASTSIIISALITAYIYGQFAGYNEQLAEKYNNFIAEFDNGNSVMHRLKCPLELQERVRDF